MESFAGDSAHRGAGMIDYSSPPRSPTAGHPQPLPAEPVRTSDTHQQHYEAGRPDPWIRRKAAIFVVLALTVWSFYVVVGRVCTPMIQERLSASALGQAKGVGTLVGFTIVWLVYVWSYLKMILAGPGLARDHVQRVPSVQRVGQSSKDDIQYLPPSLPASVSPTTRPSHPTPSDPVGPDPSEFAPVANIYADTLQTSADHPSSSATLAANTPQKDSKGLKNPNEVERPVPTLETGPRWCRFCEINKPDRTHHCRHCGTCIMQFDHHCVWIGQCVGWANHKFFINLLLWVMAFTVYILSLLISFLIKSSTRDGQIVGLIAVSALFFLFSAIMISSHLYLILTGKSTVESFAGSDQRRREADILQREYGYLFHNLEKQKVRRRWNEEWGGSRVDARWRFGTKRQLWQQEMGRSWIGWILPIGRPLGDGVHFPSNPHFGPNGEWLKRKEWPKAPQ